MKREYLTPEMEITEFEIEDVITTSGENYYIGEGQDANED